MTTTHSRLGKTELLARAGAIAAGSTALLYALPSQAAIQHVDTPLGTFSPGTSFPTTDWDVDGAFGADFHVRLGGFASLVNLDSDGNNGLGVMQNPAGTGDYIRNVALAAVVGPTLTGSYGWGSASQTGRTILLNSGGIGGDTQAFQFGDNFIGFRFDASGTTLYGWARLTLTDNGGKSNSMTIAEWAYEDGGASIEVGQTSAAPSAADEPPALALLALGAGGLAAWRRRRNRAATA